MMVHEGDVPVLNLEEPATELVDELETVTFNPDQRPFHRVFVSKEVWSDVDALILDRAPLDVDKQLAMRQYFMNIFCYEVADSLFSQLKAEQELELVAFLANKPTDEQVETWLKDKNMIREKVDTALQAAMVTITKLLNGQTTLEDLP